MVKPSWLFRILYPKAICKIKEEDNTKTVYLTFDDGPNPRFTPWVLNLLEDYNIRATFFLVGENVKKYPDIFEKIKSAGHSWGNHTMKHLDGLKCSTARYIEDIRAAEAIIGSKLFRPPHGFMTGRQYNSIKKNHSIILQDIVSEDYDRNKTPEEIERDIRKYTENGSIIVFHDSEKAGDNLRASLEHVIKWILENGYEFRHIRMD